jgi:hypothetical protein
MVAAGLFRCDAIVGTASTRVDVFASGVTVAPVPQAVLRQDLLATTKTDIHTHTEHGRHPTTTSETHEPTGVTNYQRHCSEHQ